MLLKAGCCTSEREGTEPWGLERTGRCVCVCVCEREVREVGEECVGIPGGRVVWRAKDGERIAEREKTVFEGRTELNIGVSLLM